MLDLGFSWGDDSPAAHQLSIAILYSMTQSERFAAKYYEDLCDQWTSKLPPISFEQYSAIDEWITVRYGVLKYSKYLPINPYK